MSSQIFYLCSGGNVRMNDEFLKRIFLYPEFRLLEHKDKHKARFLVSSEPAQISRWMEESASDKGVVFVQLCNGTYLHAKGAIRLNLKVQQGELSFDDVTDRLKALFAD